MADQSCSQVSTAMPAVETYSQRANPDFEAALALRTVAKEGAFSCRSSAQACGFWTWAVVLGRLRSDSPKRLPPARWSASTSSRRK